jgi:hypothetical protein
VARDDDIRASLFDENPLSAGEEVRRRAAVARHPTLAVRTRHAFGAFLDAVVFRSMYSFLGTLAALTLVAWFVTGVITGNWTDDDWNNVDCTHINYPTGGGEDLCRDRDTGELMNQ